MAGYPRQSRHRFQLAGIRSHRCRSDTEEETRSQAAGATNIEERPIRKDPATALLNLAEEVNADLLVVGNLGLDRKLGRWFSLPGSVSRRAKTEVLVVDTREPQPA
ncbi:MAG: universal stress protein [Actinomycetia bacterium]|nr:universal stress protein [Actinomycetes bacterium]